jgi:PAS domain S-box-containing protein
VEKQQRKIMIVEDEALIAADIEQRLIGLGYDVPAIADSAVTALNLIEEHRPDLVLMDIRIHGSIDGVALASHVKQQFKLPVIFLTAHADASTLQRAKLAEPFGYLVKPVGTASLPSAIEIGLYKHKMEQDLRRQRSWLETTLRSIGDGVVVTAQDGRVNSINDAALAILETTREAAVGKPLQDVVQLHYHGSRLPVEDLETLAEAEDQSMPLPAEIHTVTAGGIRRPVEGSIAACRLGDELFGSVLLFRDIAVREAAERERRDEQKMIALGRLAEGVAGSVDHLQEAIRKAMHALDSHAPSDAIEGQLRETAGAAAGLSGQLRSLIRQKGEELEAIRVRVFIEERLAELRATLAENIALSAIFHDESAAVRATREQLASILTTVVWRAGEAMPAGGTVTIETSRVPGPQGEAMVRIAVRDTGEVLAPDAVENLFEPFYATKSRAADNGLGLAAAYAAVSTLGGFLAVDSKPGAGTTVEIYLPAATLSKTAPDGHWPTVLLVEENESLRRTLHNFLESHDYNLLEASGEGDALDLAEVFDGKIDLLVADAASQDLAKQLIAVRPEMKLLFAIGSMDAAKETIKAEWILKPIRKAELLKKVEEMVTE